MIFVLIPSKPSKRFPGKNKILFPWTFYWLARELKTPPQAERVVVATVGVRAEFPDVLPVDWRHFECATGTHRGDIEFACDCLREQFGRSKDDVFVMLQITQPKRRAGLLWEAIDKARKCGSVISACETEDQAWRRILDCGNDMAVLSGMPNTQPCLIHDGAIYAWTHGSLAQTFDKVAPHGVVVNYRGAICDVDFPGDMPSPSLSFEEAR